MLVQLTKRDEHRDDDSEPENALSAKHNNFVYEVTALEERVYHDPREHH